MEVEAQVKGRRWLVWDISCISWGDASERVAIKVAGGPRDSLPVTGEGKQRGLEAPQKVNVWLLRPRNHHRPSQDPRYIVRYIQGTKYSFNSYKTIIYRKGKLEVHENAVRRPRSLLRDRVGTPPS